MCYDGIVIIFNLDNLIISFHFHYCHLCVMFILCAIFRWRKYKIPVSYILQCHLLDYENHLLSIVLSHCHYSLRHGKGQDVTYDYPALEKHLVDRFIHGKPLIQLEIPQVVYRKDVYSVMTFANIRKKVKPQVSGNE